MRYSSQSCTLYGANVSNQVNDLAMIKNINKVSLLFFLLIW